MDKQHDDFCERATHEQIAGEAGDPDCVGPVRAVEGLGMWLEGSPVGPMVAFDTARGVRLGLPRAEEAHRALGELIADGKRARSARAGQG